MSNVTMRVVLFNARDEEMDASEPTVVNADHSDLIAAYVADWIRLSGCYVGDSIRIERVQE